MNAIGIVEVLNKKFDSIKCNDKLHFILQKEIRNTCFTNAYKEYIYTLWYINGNDKYIVFGIHKTDRVVTEREQENIVKYMEERLLTHIFNLLQDNNNLMLMANGRFTGFSGN